MQASAEEVVELVADVSSVFQVGLLLINVLNLVDKLVLPAVELDALDVLEGLVDVKHSLVTLLPNLLVDILLRVLPVVAEQELRDGEEHDDETVPANRLICEVEGSDEDEGAFEPLRHLPNEIPNSVRIVHDDGADLALREILIRRRTHPQVFLEEERLQSSVHAVAQLSHLEAEVLPDRVVDNANQGNEEG